MSRQIYKHPKLDIETLQYVTDKIELQEVIAQHNLAKAETPDDMDFIRGEAHSLFMLRYAIKEMISDQLPL